MRRRTLAVALVSAWLACLGWLAARRLQPVPEGTPGRAVTRLAPGAVFYAVTLAGRQIGTAGTTLDTTTQGYRLTEVVSLDLPAAKGSRRHVMRGEAILTRSLQLQSAQVAVSEAGRAQAADAERRGDSAVAFRARRDRDVVDRTQIALDTQAVMTPGAIPLRLAAARLLRPRGELKATTADVLSRTLRQGTVQVGADTILVVADTAAFDSTAARFVAVGSDSVRAWRVARGADAGLPAVEWVDAGGRVVRREHAFGVVLERSPFEVNYTNYQAGLRQGQAAAPSEFPGASLLVAEAPGRPASESPRRVVVARWDGAAWPGSAMGFAGGRQYVVGDTVEIRARPEGGADTTASPRQRNTDPGPSWRLDPLTGALTEALATVSPGEDTVAALARWVARAVRYLDSEAAPSGSVTTARLRRGDLEGMVSLFVALAGLAGYPARPVYGLDVGRETLPAHLWAEVWRDGWEAVDPVLGQAPASTTLLRVGEGATVRPLVMVTQVGGLRVRTLQ
jgi:hypothetical protein